VAIDRQLNSLADKVEQVFGLINASFATHLARRRYTAWTVREQIASGTRLADFLLILYLAATGVCD
jgi:hypothetical protein